MLYYRLSGNVQPRLDDLEEQVLPVASDEGERLHRHGGAVHVEISEHVGAAFNQRMREASGFIDFLLR
jgi:hypothetical protein